MANPEHLRILKKGVKAWNKWRQIEPDMDGELRNANLRGIGLEGADLQRADLSGANLSTANLSSANVALAKFDSADLSGANLSRADLSATSLRGANLCGATLYSADLFMTNLSGANLRKADLRFVTARRAVFNLADLGGASLDRTIFSEVYLQNVMGLETVLHEGPSTIGIDTVYFSQGKIPESFLRGSGVPETLITFMKSLTASAFDFYSAFISYSSKNQDAADQIHTDLQAKGVRCWLATEDLKIGDPFRQRIDESIKLHDKLLLILSEHSVQSPWVQDEVEAALERERRDKRLVLFPIRIDDAVMDTDAAWAASIRRTRHIGDFTRWKDHHAYQKAFERLLRDLKAESKAKDKEAGR